MKQIGLEGKAEKTKKLVINITRTWDIIKMFKKEVNKSFDTEQSTNI
jgi:hypothetical protein